MRGSMEKLIDKMLGCTLCSMRKGCTQVVPPTGNLTNPILLIIGESPGQQEDEYGEQFIGEAGQLLREVLRETKILNRSNTAISCVLKCRPPKNKFPKDESASICFSTWLSEEIKILKPQRMLLLGSVPLEYVAKMDGITRCRGNWVTAHGIRTIATFHPSYIIRTDRDGMKVHRDVFERDIFEVAGEVAEIEKSNGKPKDNSSSSL